MVLVLFVKNADYSLIVCKRLRGNITQMAVAFVLKLLRRPTIIFGGEWDLGL